MDSVKSLLGVPYTYWNHSGSLAKIGHPTILVCILTRFIFHNCCETVFWIGLFERLTMCYLEKEVEQREMGIGTLVASVLCTRNIKSTHIWHWQKKELISIVNYAQRWELFRYANLHRGGTIWSSYPPEYPLWYNLK